MLLGIVDFKGCYPQMAFCLKIWPHSNQSKPHVARSISNMKCMRLMDSPLLAMPKEIQRVKFSYKNLTPFSCKNSTDSTT